VRLHGGRIWAEAIPAAGTAVRFTLPLEAAPQMEAEPVTAS
jgi:signal transduction histidine kinase